MADAVVSRHGPRSGGESQVVSDVTEAYSRHLAPYTRVPYLVGTQIGYATSESRPKRTSLSPQSTSSFASSSPTPGIDASVSTGITHVRRSLARRGGSRK